MDTVADKLREARALVAKGWTQHKFRKIAEDGTCSYCADGALCEVTQRDGSEVYRSAAKSLQKAMGVREYAYMWAWNDNRKRTQSEVVAAFDKAIELAEAGQ